jgi:endonuclease III
MSFKFNISIIKKIYSILKTEFKKNKVPVVDLIEIQTKDPFKVLVTTILSSRTKDQTTLSAAKRLFDVVKNLDDLEKISVKNIEKLIYPVGFYKIKARNLKKLPFVIKSLFGGKIPQTIEDLLKLPGVGRKTANLVLAIAFNKPAVCVDVHVHRICNRLGLVKTKNPFETEMSLKKILPKKMWRMFNSYLVSYGQHTCLPIKPKCNICKIYKFCKKIGVKS